MKDKWRRMSRRDLQAAMAVERQRIAEVEGKDFGAVRTREHEAVIDEIASELSRREITRYTAIAAVTGVIAALASIAAMFI